MSFGHNEVLTDKPYVPPFGLIKRLIGSPPAGGVATATVPYENVINAIKMLVRAVHVDEAWYLSRYPDVKLAIVKDMVSSASHHYSEYGYFEGRLPFKIRVDEGWYIGRYTDVAKGLKAGTITSAQQHFMDAGYAEGREPFPL